MSERAVVVGAGLAGCEAALWLADHGVQVALFEQKPERFSPAHKSAGLAELVCSNSLKAERVDSAAGLLKVEMRLLGSKLLPVADGCRVPAGGALAVDRDAFSAGVTALVERHPNIELHRVELERLADLPALVPGFGPHTPVIVAAGPLAQGALADEIGRLVTEAAKVCDGTADAARASERMRTGADKADAGVNNKGEGDAARESGALLNFYDAAAPIVTADSLDMEQIFAASRYGRGDDDYLNCPFDKAGYEAFYEALIDAERAPVHGFDAPGSGEDAGLRNASGAGCSAAQSQPAPQSVPVYEGCMPVEVMARRGPDTLRFGPMRPVGLVDPRTGHRPWANVQLRREDAAGTLYNLVGFQTNLRFGEQKRVFGMIPGLQNAEFARYGVMHRNTFLNSPRVLGPDLALRGRPGVFFAGQITGFEGYMESAACGLLAARVALAFVRGGGYTPPPADTMCGALSRYIQTPNKDFQPMGANMGILPPLEAPERDKRLRYQKLVDRALAALEGWMVDSR